MNAEERRTARKTTARLTTRPSLVAAITCLLLTLGRGASGQTAMIRGTVVDSSTGAPVSGVLIASLTATNTVAATASTDQGGRFRLVGLGALQHTLLLRRVGYADRRVVVAPRDSEELVIALAHGRVFLDPIQVTASRVPESVVDAPTAMSVIERPQIEQQIGFTPMDYVRTLPGVDFASKGIMQHVFAVRGLRPLGNGPMLTLIDDRRSSNSSYLVAPTNDDIERIEFARGPGAALYGPGAARGVLQIITRSPFESPGSTFSLATGERDLMEGTVRFARILSPRTAFKVSGSWLQGHDWESRDSTEVRIRRQRLAAGADPDTLLIGSRDFHSRRATTEVRFDWRPDSATTLTSSVGGVDVFNLVDAISDVSAVQLRDSRYGFAQLKVQRRRLLANLTYGVTDAGNTFDLRSGKRLGDHSHEAAAQLQDGWGSGRVDLLYGVDGFLTDPETGAGHQVREVGAYAQSRVSVSPRLELVSALRSDHNDRMNDLVISPRAAVILKPAPGHALRLTYNRAFTAPGPGELFLNNPVPNFPFAVRQVAVPQGGFSFRRDCGGICMRSPYNPAGGDQYLPADATIAWDSVVARLARAGRNVSDIPRPNSSQVGTRLAELDGMATAWTFKPVSASDIADMPPRRRAIYETVEIGYKGNLDRPLTFSLDVYSSRVKDPVGGVVVVTRTVFFDSTTLARYLSGFRTPDEAGRLAGLIDTMRVGAISPKEASDPQEILRARRQGGVYTFWGSDLGLRIALSSRVDLEGSYSWISQNLMPDVDPDAPHDITLVVPKKKGAATLRYHDDRVGLVAALGARVIGDFIATTMTYEVVEGYNAVDASVAYPLPWTAGVTVAIKASNLFNNLHRELAGQPAMGRLIVARVRVAM